MQIKKEDFNTILNEIGEYGVVDQVFHPIVRASGLPGARVNEIVLFETGDLGQVVVLNRDLIEIVNFSKHPIKSDTKVVRTNTQLSIPVGLEYLGSLIDPLGNLLFEGKDFKKSNETKHIDQKPPKIYERIRINEQLETGITVLDILLPIGKGQRELIVGDRKTGKTSVFLTLIKNQAKKGLIIIYAAIGMRGVEIKKLKEYFEREGVMKNIVIVATSSQDSPSLIDLTPYSAMTMAEYYKDMGKDVITIFDDLTTHARFYREISLIAKRFPGRDSYPGDIFHRHAKLLERAGNFKHPEKGNVSITCLPVAETNQRNLTDYIVSNLIGITDGHILFDIESFNKGVRPAVNIFLSVTRVGKQTQDKLSRDINKELMIFLIKYERAQRFSHCGAELSREIKDTLVRGKQIYNFFEQGYDTGIPLTVQKIAISMIWSGLFLEEETPQIGKKRNILLNKYNEQAETREFINQLINVENFKELNENVEKYKQRLTILSK